MTARHLPLQILRPMAAAMVAAALAIAGVAYRDSIGGALDRLGADVERRLGLRLAVIDIRGNENATREEILAAIGGMRDRRLGALDLDAIRQRIESLGWVAEAEIGRRLPDSLRITVRERTPVALWQRGGRLVLIDAEGAVITDQDLARWRHLPQVVGAGANEAARALLQVIEIDRGLADRIKVATRRGERRWDLEFTNGVVVRLPEDRSPTGNYDLAAAWARLAALDNRHRLLARDIVIVDLRLADRLVVRLTPGGRLLSLGEEQST